MPSSVDLGKRLESTVSKLVAKGRYNSRSEVLREGVRLVEEREKTLAQLEAALARGVADIKAGRVHSSGDVRAAVHERIREVRARQTRKIA